MNSVLILLSTYNGSHYLSEQIDSLISQVNVELHILVRDDGSTDDTLKILEHYKNTKGNLSIIYGKNVGAGPSFMALIKEASEKYPDYDYYAFSDQDDVWFPHKVETGLRALEKSNNSLRFYFSGAVNTDSELNPIGASHVRVVNSFGANLVANHILGCTMMFNRALLLEINKINTMPYSIPNGVPPIHDAWSAIVAYSLNADVIQGSSALMYYRQHGNNVIGAGHGSLSIYYNRIKRYIGKATHGKANKCIIANQVLGDIMPDENRKMVELVCNYRDNLFSKFKLLANKNIYQYSCVDNLGTFLTILFNKF